MYICDLLWLFARVRVDVILVVCVVCGVFVAFCMCVLPL